MRPIVTQDKQHDVMAKRRLDVVVALVALGLALMVIRAVDLQWMQTENLTSKAESQRYRQFEVSAPRGPIVDTQGRVLSESVEVPSIAALGADLNPEDLPQLAKVLHMDIKELQRKVGKRQGFIWLDRQVTPHVAKAVQALNIPGVRIEKEWQRFHPFGPETGHLLGFVGIDNRGLEGLERSYNQVLTGKSGRMQIQRAANGAELPGSVWLNKPEPGQSLYLNLNVNVQSIAYAALAKGIENTGAKGGSVVVMNPHNGAVLAMTSWPGFNPNSFSQYRAKDWRNRVVTDVFEPGSVMKPFTVAAALSTGRWTADSLIFCENGNYEIADKVIHDDHPEGWIDIRKLLVVSSNIGAAKLALDVGKKDLNRLLTDVGFREKTNIGLGGESPGILLPLESWGQVETANIAFGQGVAVTPIQLATAFSIFANGGVYYPPQLVKSDEDIAGRRIISEKVATDVLGMMADVTLEGGTGMQAVPLGYTVAGKTGTAQKPNPQGGYSKEKYTAVFAGAVPAEAPALVIVVVLDEPKSSIYASSTAAPVFKQVAAAALPQLGIVPNLPTAQPSNMQAQNQTSAWGMAKANAPQQEQLNSLYGLSLRDVRRFAYAKNIQLRLHGKGWVSKSEPSVLHGLKEGDAMEVWLNE